MMFDKKSPKKENSPEKETNRKPLDLSLNLMDKLKNFGLSKLIGVLAAGILLLLFLSELMGSTANKSQVTEKSDSTSKQNLQNSCTTEEYKRISENRFKQVLMKVEDIGDVEVMITVKASKESVILKDKNSQEETTEEEDSAGGSRKSSSKNSQDETVLDQSESGASSPYVVKVLEPEIEGIVVIADGGNNEKVKSEIVAAAQALFKVPAHKVIVMKMNQE